jgi:hypothetical protein
MTPELPERSSAAPPSPKQEAELTRLLEGATFTAGQGLFLRGQTVEVVITFWGTQNNPAVPGPIEAVEAAGAPPEDLGELVRQLRDGDSARQEAAARALGAMGPAAATPEVLAALASLVFGDDWRIAAIAAEAVDRLGKGEAIESYLQRLETPQAPRQQRTASDEVDALVCAFGHDGLRLRLDKFNLSVQGPGELGPVARIAERGQQGALVLPELRTGTTCAISINPAPLPLVSARERPRRARRRPSASHGWKWARRKVVMAVLGAGALAAAVGWLVLVNDPPCTPADYRTEGVSGSGLVDIGGRVRGLAFTTPGRVDNVLAKQDDRVPKGQPLVRLESWEDRMKVAEANKAVDPARLDLVLLVTRENELWVGYQQAHIRAVMSQLAAADVTEDHIQERAYNKLSSTSDLEVARKAPGEKGEIVGQQHVPDVPPTRRRHKSDKFGQQDACCLGRRRYPLAQVARYQRRVATRMRRR